MGRMRTESSITVPGRRYEKWKTIYDGGDKSVNTLWKLTAACLDKSRSMIRTKQMVVLNEALFYIEEAYIKEPTNFEVVKWNAIIVGHMVEHQPPDMMMEKGRQFVELLDKAISLNPNDHTLLFLRGRYYLTFTSLTKSQQRIVENYFGAIPNVTLREVSNDFLAAYNVAPKWIDNLLYLAKIHACLKEKDKSRQFLREAVQLFPANESQAKYLEECRSLLIKLGNH